MTPSKPLLAVSWILQIAAAVILLQTLFFKFTAAEESVFLFSTIHAEPWGRIASGVVELIAALLLLYPPTITFGAVLAMGVMTGAIATHLTVLGIEVKNDGGLLFVLAIAVFAASAVILLIRRAQIPVLGRLFAIAG
jgi:hypothetical protein